MMDYREGGGKNLEMDLLRYLQKVLKHCSPNSGRLGVLISC